MLTHFKGHSICLQLASDNMIQGSSRRSKAKAVLTKEQAIAAFLQKYTNEIYASTTEKSCAVASDFRISPKTVRDIWAGRSWLDATYDLWQQVIRHC